MKYLEQENSLCSLCGEYHIFIIYKNDDKYYSFELQTEFDISHSLVVWDNYEEMLSGITWNDDIFHSIIDDTLRHDVQKLLGYTGN